MIEVYDASAVSKWTWWIRHLPAVISAIKAVMTGKCYGFEIDENGIRNFVNETAINAQLKEWKKEITDPMAEEFFEEMQAKQVAKNNRRLRPGIN